MPVTEANKKTSEKINPILLCLAMLAWIIPGILSYYFWHKKTEGIDISGQNKRKVTVPPVA